jgi:hypothetical protein
MVERTSIDEEPIVGVGLPGYPGKSGVDEAVISFELGLLRDEQVFGTASETAESRLESVPRDLSRPEVRALACLRPIEGARRSGTPRARAIMHAIPARREPS